MQLPLIVVAGGNVFTDEGHFRHHWILTHRIS